jgi:exonuclease III
MWYNGKVAGTVVTESNKWDLCFSSINVNSLNISTYKEGQSKTLEKLVAITGRGRDIIFMSDCRLGRGIEKLRRILQLGTKTSYNLYSNSTRGDRGVCIAISRSRNVEVLEEVKETVHENYLLLKCKIDQKDILIGAVYGPNTNNVVFYRDLIEKIERYSMPTVIGGDWNTVLDRNRGAENLDLEDRDNIPQRENGRILSEWLEQGNYCEPFRRKYPMAHTMSYIPFRTRRRVGNGWVTENYGKSRLDFYIISEELEQEVESVFYGDRLSRDFDHLEAKLGTKTLIR